MEHTMNLNDVLLRYADYQMNARKILNPSCRVCKICNGVACAGRFTNSLEFGGKGNNGGFINAVRGLADIQIELDPIIRCGGTAIGPDNAQTHMDTYYPDYEY